jgi:fumarate reductase flavoprotein subunit
MLGTTGCDVAVVGAGLAGLAAANRAAMLGCRVVVVEKGERGAYPCNSRIATGVLGLAHSDPTDKPGTLFKAIMDDTEGYAKPELAELLAQNASRALRWLRDENVKVIKAVSDNKIRWVLAPPKLPKPGHDWQGRGPHLALQTLAENLERRGGRVLYGMRARQLIMHDGRCTGVRIEDGQRLREIAAGCVVLADGGFQGNMDLLRRFISPHPDRLVQRNAETGQGDALQMAEAAGARLTETSSFYGHLLVQEALGNRELWPYPTIDSLASSAVIVDEMGRRFIDEGLGGIPLSNAIARLPGPLAATVIFDHIAWTDAGRIEFIPPNPYVTRLGGTVTEAPDLPGLAAAVGLPTATLVETVQSYNHAVETGDMTVLQPPRTLGRSFGQLRSSPKRLPVRPICQAPFYAIRLCAGISYTLGGIEVDAETRVIDSDGVPIPGLYAAGACTGGLEGGPIAGYVGGLLKALCFGLAAGDAVAKIRKPTNESAEG